MVEKTNSDNINPGDPAGELFDVWREFSNGVRERVREGVTAQAAIKAVSHYCNSVGALIGTTKEVLIVDVWDNTVFHWVYGKGIVFPNPAAKSDSQ